jgi:uncharacterized protein (TIGR02246 family)
MTPQEQPFYEIVQKLEAAWNSGDSVAWTSQFADDADFIHILGGHFHGREAIERGHRQIFDTIYKGSCNKITVQKIRFLRPDVAIVFVFAELMFYMDGKEQHIQARPTLIAAKESDGSWKIVTFQNTLVTPEGGPSRDNRQAEGIHAALADRHPIKGTPKASE